MEENNKSGYTADGKKLRPRRPRISERVYGSSDRSHDNNHSERRSYGDGSRSSYGEKRAPYGERRNYGENSERRSYGSSERRSYGGGNRGGYDQRRSTSFGERRNYGDNENKGGYGDSERRTFSGGGERRNYGENSQRKNYGSSERRSYGGDRHGAGENRSEHRSFGNDRGERRSYGNDRRAGFGKPQGGRSFGKPQAAKRFAPKKEKFTFSEDSGIDRMISARPQVANMEYSDNDNVATGFKEVIRLNKFIANSGVCSRREADQMIQAGVVTVNGEIVTELGTKVNVLKDDIKFNGETLRGEKKVYIVMNKPKGYVTTASDPHADKTVMDLLKGCTYRVFPVGRLDKNTTGVLMFTNDGEIAEKLTHPSYDKKKIYQVILDHEVSQEDHDKILEGLELGDGEVKADDLQYIDDQDHRKMGIEIHSGKNRIVRRIFESLGYEVKALDRVYFAGLTKKGMKKGEWRYLTDGEANILKMGAYL